MTLYNANQNFAPWNGEPINDVLHPLTIEYFWSAEELSAIGLYKDSMIVDTPVPEGKVSVGKSIEMVEGVPTWVHVLIDIPVPEVTLPILKPYQFWGMVKASGYETDLRTAIAALPEPHKSFSEAMLEYSLEFRRDHPLVESIKVVLQMNDTELDLLWLQASQL